MPRARAKSYLSGRSRSSIRMKRIRAKLSQEELDARRAAIREKVRIKRANETAQEREKRNQRERLAAKTRRTRQRYRKRSDHQNEVFKQLTKQDTNEHGNNKSDRQPNDKTSDLPKEKENVASTNAIQEAVVLPGCQLVGQTSQFGWTFGPKGRAAHIIDEFVSV